MDLKESSNSDGRGRLTLPDDELFNSEFEIKTEFLFFSLF